MQALMLSLLGLGIIMCLGASVGMWISAMIAARSGRPIVPPEPRPRYPGGLAEILIALGIYIVVSGVLTGLYLGQTSRSNAAPTTDLSRLVPLIVINSLGTLAAVIAVLGWLRMQGFTWRELGLRLAPHHLSIGIRGLVMTLPPVMILQAFLASLIEYSHPVLEILRQPQPLMIIAVMAISSTLVAPLTEEFFFRGLLQGWLERVAGVGLLRPVHGSFGTAVETTATTPMLAAEPYAPPVPVVPTTEAVPTAADPPAAEPLIGSQPRPVWPMVVSSLAFALVHLGQGPAPITLFFLALGIGYLYRQTGSIWPGIVVHMGLNGLTTTVTILTMYQ